MVDIAPSLLPFDKGVRRPPTPPKESTTHFPRDNGIEDMLPIRPALDTPEDSPSSSAELVKGISGKRVKISGHYQYHHPPGSSSNKGYDSDDLRQLPPSRECKSTRSILKVSRESHLSLDQRENPSLDDTSLDTMLRSAALHLGSQSTSARIDAYNSLVTCLGTYEDEPKNDDLAIATSELCRYIRRDLSTRLAGSVVSDMQLVSPALKLVLALFATNGVANNMPDEFKVYLVEQALASMVDGKKPKMIVTQYMHVLEKQKFGGKILTLDRTAKIFNVLDTIHLRFKGMRIEGHRLMIYKRLLTQAKSQMLSKPDKWLHHLLRALISPIRDTRKAAIALGVEAGMVLGGGGGHFSKDVIEICSQRLNQDQTTFEIVQRRVLKMLKSREEAIHVPQIWAVFVLLLRHRRSQMQQWEHWNSWFDMLKQCLDYPDLLVRHQAQIALNRLIYAVHGDMMTSSMGKIVIDLIRSQMEVKEIDGLGEKESRSSRQSARDTYCMLLYYTFKPNAPPERLKQGWDLFIVGMEAPLKAMSANYMADVLASLLHYDGGPRVWNDRRAFTGRQVLPNELPCLDAKWIRSQIRMVIKPIRSLLDRASWTLRQDQDILIGKVWRNLLSALENASSKEVRASSETLHALAHILNHIGYLLEQRTGFNNRSAIPAEAISSAIEETMSKIGTHPFNEKKLILTADRSLEMISETPSRRSKSDSKTLNSGVFHLLQLLMTKGNESDGDVYATVIAKLVQLALKGAHSKSGNFNILRNISQLCSLEYKDRPDQTSSLLWKAIGEAAIENFRSEGRLDDTVKVAENGHALTKIVLKILDFGIPRLNLATVTTWQTLFDEVSAALASEIGNFAITLALAEPLTGVVRRHLETSLDEFALKAVLKLLQGAHWPQTRHASERVQALLWGPDAISKGHDWSSPSEDLLSLINLTLAKSYSAIDELPHEQVASLLTLVTSVLQSCPAGSRLSLLEALQTGLAVWFEDASRNLAISSSDEMTSKVKQMWAAVSNIVETANEPPQKLLHTLPTLLTATFTSRHKDLLNDTIRIWNRVFGCEETLDYPLELKEALIKLAAMTDLDLPGLPRPQQEDVNSPPDETVETSAENPQAGASSTGVLDSQMDETEEALGIMLPRRVNSPMLPLPNFGLPREPKSSPRLPSLKGEPTLPLSQRRKAKNSTPKARLRHDDSQIQFTSIDSSPLPSDALESQVLTERQKEVSARQVEDAAMFPEIRSSPKGTSNSKPEKLPDFVLKSKEARGPLLDADTESSPTFPPDNIMQEFLGSSPTPSSSRRRSSERSPDEDLPSSPPFVSSHLQVPFPPSAEPHAGVSETQHIPEEHQHDQDDKRQHLEEERKQDNEPIVEDANGILSDQDVFVDAPSEPMIDINTVMGIEKENKALPQRHEADDQGQELQFEDKARQVSEERLLPDEPQLPDEHKETNEEPQGLHEEFHHSAEAQETNDEVQQTNGDVQQIIEDNVMEVELPPAVEVDQPSIEEAGKSRSELNEEVTRLLNSFSSQFTASVEEGERDDSPRAVAASLGRETRKRKHSDDGEDSPCKRFATAPTEVEGLEGKMAGQEVEVDCVLIESGPSQDWFQTVSPQQRVEAGRAATPDINTLSWSVEETILSERRRSSSSTGSLGRTASHERTKQKRHTTLSGRKRDSGKEKGSRPSDLHDDAVDMEPRPGQVIVSSEAGRSETNGRVDMPASSGASIIQGAQDLLGQLKQASLRPEEEGELLSLIWEIGREAQAACRRTEPRTRTREG